MTATAIGKVYLVGAPAILSCSLSKASAVSKRRMRFFSMRPLAQL